MQKKFAVLDIRQEFQYKSFLPQILEFVSSSLKELKLNSKEAVRTELMCEEALVNLIEHGDFSKNKFVSVNVKKFLGDVSVELKVPGNEFDFYIDGGLSLSEDDDNDAVEAVRNLLLRSFSDKIKYKHQRNFNTVKITAFHSQYSALYQVLAALILAIITGFVLNNFASAEFISNINGNFLEPLYSLLLNGLKMCAMPIMFFSVVSCFSQMGGGTDLSKMKRAGGKMLFYAMFFNVTAIFIGALLLYIFDIGKDMNLTALSSSSMSNGAQNVSLSTGDIIKGFVPDNFLKPFFEGNMIQLMVLAILIGIAAGASNSKIIASAFDEINKIFVKVLAIFLRFMPLLVFCSITSMFISTGLKTLLLVLSILLILSAGYALLWIKYYFMLLFIARLNPFTVFKKAITLIITSLTTCSSVASIPAGMESAKKIGVSEKIYSFLIPLGTLTTRNANCLFLYIITIVTANMYGVEITLSKMFLVSIYAIILSIVIPSIPGGLIITCSSIFVSIGCPLDGLGIIIALNSVMDMFVTTSATMSTLLSTLIIAKSENQLDIEKYKS